jgi:hypothetical protein
MFQLRLRRQDSGMQPLRAQRLRGFYRNVDGHLAGCLRWRFAEPALSMHSRSERWAVVAPPLCQPVVEAGSRSALRRSLPPLMGR